MEKEISLSKVFLVVVFAVLTSLCYHLGIVDAAEACVAGVLHTIYYVLVAMCVGLIVLSLGASTSSASADVKYHREANDVWGRQWLDSTVVSFVAAVFAIIAGGLTEIFATQAELGIPSAEMFGFETLFFVFWKPYLWSHVISLVLGVMHYLDKKYKVFRKLKLRIQKVFRW
ncbi:MAG: hypothetical protein M0P64_00890 [Candidatus Pacebacteria bacterium]|jgi:hypothetical protein|nr:hypothetical protein [Candidatus Paceibacterota bacterium]